MFESIIYIVTLAKYSIDNRAKEITILYIEVCQYIVMTPFHVINIFKALADKTRARIVAFLAVHGESSCQEVSKHIKLSQPTVCHHFTKLAECGVISLRKQGVHNYYRLNGDNLEQAGVESRALVKIFNS